MLRGKKRLFLGFIYLMAAVQFVWCYMSLSESWISTPLYENGLAKMPYQGRMLMMFPLRWAHSDMLFHLLADPLHLSHYWFSRHNAPEVLVQAVINVLCVLLAGYLTTKLYVVSSRTGLLRDLVFPVFLVACTATYIMHTAQNLRFVYDLPSLAFFSVAMCLIYFRKHWGYFVALFIVATVNRETTLFLLPLFMLDRAVEDGRLNWRLLFRPSTLAVFVPLGFAWIGWEAFVHHLYAHNPTEMYPRLWWNEKSLLLVYAWPQLLSTCGFLLPFMFLLRRKIRDPQLVAWMWIVPVWGVFMFVFGILVETRVFGELIPYVVCTSSLILEDLVIAKVQRMKRYGYQVHEEGISVRRAA
ncbi:hypothetical protein GCM10011507_10360 [Edaphobacter acidisoli]|uniref:Uncharacterized protein n=1 Tax=Edaphobacter acidisoli TaxID=2040573 RepID=A0A916W2G4_9BACT|nr:hypothetical protein [Edaphobacter acidisoli]GGA60755.1 hypothetical protein GCM10011507_10360 [Edaphobacter acidisoli]